MTTMTTKNDDFREAVTKRLADRGESLAWLGAELGVTRQAAQQWMVKAPNRERVEQIEDLLDMPGQLCRLLGYERAGHVLEPGATFAEAVANDPLLSDRDRRLLLELYRSLVGR